MEDVGTLSALVHQGPQPVIFLSLSGIFSRSPQGNALYLLMFRNLPTEAPKYFIQLNKQRKIKDIIDSKEKARVIRLLTQINGGRATKMSYKHLLRLNDTIKVLFHKPWRPIC
jgi:hypothetical protein